MWDDLYEKLYPELVRYAASAWGETSEAEDAVQEVFLKALQNAATLEGLGPSQRRAWLYRALKNRMCDTYRRRKLENAWLEEIREEAAAPDPGIQETENRLLLETLSPQDRALFHLRYEEGYPASELAEIFGVPAGTIRARLSRMRSQLKTMIE